jgi:hypothetical protein
MDRKRIVVMGFMGGCPIAGVIWQHLHYIAGLQRLGHEVYYIEDSARYVYNPVTYEENRDYAYAVQTLGRLAERFGFEGRWAFCARFFPEQPTAGLTLERIRDLYRTADAILSVCGAQEFNEDLLVSQNLIYIESDPGLEQIRVDNGDGKARASLLRNRERFTFGENVGTPLFPVPLHGIRWLPTRQPVVTDFWRTDAPPPPGALFTTVANWNTSGLKDIEWRGSRYLWSKSLEFLKFVEAPARAGEDFEIAATVRDEETQALFHENRWRIVPPDRMSIDWDLYRSYLQASKGEFTAAKDQYVRLNTAWFSDRTACYLACGRPAITQETGFTRLFGGKAGLLAFTTLDDVVEHVRSINADYKVHSRAAFEIAAEHFEATKVLSDLLNRAGV